MNEIKIKDNVIKIINSYEVSKHDFHSYYDEVKTLSPDNSVVNHRKYWHMDFEWSTHNLLYKLGLFRSHTQNVDLEYPQKWYNSVLYFITGPFCWLFIK